MSCPNTTAMAMSGIFIRWQKKTGNINEEDFKYRGKKPQTKEAGVLMLADIVDAAVRAQ